MIEQERRISFSQIADYGFEYRIYFANNKLLKTLVVIVSATVEPFLRQPPVSSVYSTFNLKQSARWPGDVMAIKFGSHAFRMLEVVNKFFVNKKKFTVKTFTSL
jgi:hypothetical protein